MGTQRQRKSQAYSQLLFGRGPGGDASLREAASPEFVHSPHRIGRGGSVSRRDRNQVAGNCAHLAWARNAKGKVKLIPSYSSGGGPGETLLLEKRPLPEIKHFSCRIGRGGSVSRRDRNQVAGNCAQLAWARNSEGRVKPIPSYSSGEGVWGRGASLREAASPPESPSP